MPTEVQIGVNNAPSNPEFIYLIGVCGQGLNPYTGNPTSETSIIVDLEDYGWSEGQQYCYEIAELTTFCSCSGEGPVPSSSPTPTNTTTPTNTPTNTLTPTLTPTETDDMLYHTLTACTISDSEQSISTVSYYCENVGANINVPTLINEICDLAPIADPVSGVIDDQQILCFYQYYFGTGDTSNIQLLDVNDDGVLSTSDLLSFLSEYGSLDILAPGYCTSYPTTINCNSNVQADGIYYIENQNACYVVTDSVPYSGQPTDNCVTLNTNYATCQTCQDENVYLWQIAQTYAVTETATPQGFVSKTIAFSPNSELTSSDGSITGATHIFITVLGSSEGGPEPNNTALLTSYSAGTLHIYSTTSANSIVANVELVGVVTTSYSSYVSFQITSLVSYTNEPPFNFTDVVNFDLFEL